ncbi:MAG: hypothetical protein AB7K71_01930 [Polyangiaceae bacterium]
MGYDTSFHPVDQALIDEAILPYLLGERDEIDELLSQAVRIAQVRFRANAIGLGALKADPPEAWKGMLHVWGRPFLVTQETTAGIARVIDAYLEATPEHAEEIARSELDALQPGFSARVVPSTSGNLPPPSELRAQITYRCDVLRACVSGLREGKAEITVGDRDFEPASLVGRELMDVSLELAANLRPGWMSRGYTWPSHLIGDFRFAPNTSLVKRAVSELPSALWCAESGIIENYMVGGYVPADRVGALRKSVSEVEDEDGDLALDLKKLSEALADAELRGLPFAEATEIYSGMSGIMN